MTWEEALALAKGPGIAAIAGVIIFYIGLVWQGWKDWNPVLKRFITLGICFLIPIGADLIGTYVPPEVLQKYWPLLYAGGMAAGTFTFSQVAHAFTLKKESDQVKELKAQVIDLQRRLSG